MFSAINLVILLTPMALVMSYLGWKSKQKVQRDATIFQHLKSTEMLCAKVNGDKTDKILEKTMGKLGRIHNAKG